MSHSSDDLELYDFSTNVDDPLKMMHQILTRLSFFRTVSGDPNASGTQYPDGAMIIDRDTGTIYSKIPGGASVPSGDSGHMVAANNLSDVVDAVAALANLNGLNLDNNLSDLADAAIALANLSGLDKTDIVTQGDAEAGTATDAKAWTAERVAQAIAAQVTATGDMLGANNLSEVVDASAARTNIGAGTGDGDLVSSNNLSDVADAATSLANLSGLDKTDIVTQGDAEAGTATDAKTWTAERVGQAIAAQAGGGSSDPILTADPVAPVEEERWYLHTPPVAGTTMFSDNQEIFSGLEWIDPGVHTGQNLLDAFSNQGSAPQYEMSITDQGNPLQVNTLTDIQYESGTDTIDDLVAAINAFASPIFGGNVVQRIAGLSGSELMGDPIFEEFTVVTVAEAGNMQNTSFILGEQSVSGQGYFWMNVNGGGSDPDTLGDPSLGLEIAVALGATAGAIGDSIAAAVVGDTLNGGGPRWSVVSNDNNGTVVIADLGGGDTPDGDAFDSPFSVSTTLQGGQLQDSVSNLESDAQPSTLEHKVFKGGRKFSQSYA